jgi:hypothetical protein
MGRGCVPASDRHRYCRRPDRAEPEPPERQCSLGVADPDLCRARLAVRRRECGCQCRRAGERVAGGQPVPVSAAVPIAIAEPGGFIASRFPSCGFPRGRVARGGFPGGRFPRGGFAGSLALGCGPLRA